MAKLQLLPLLAALCLSLAGAALAARRVDLAIPTFVVEGRVYCDTCRAGFETSASKYIEGAKVKLECKHFDSGAVEHTSEGVTDATGTYHIEVEHNHEEEICEVVLVKSPMSGCTEVDGDRSRARVLVSGRSGLATEIRYTNSLGFLKSQPLPECGLLLQQYALGVDE
ncbi:pollen-specific protein C13-like [Canna indica]|uniref:Pollen-specific protein C13-like n=1 Tax=Canna indica TaxID=4628 RepID=A0AAQ3QGT9_9LILI|nr:pollen-specific protein C13-like [Canna indica]